MKYPKIEDNQYYVLFSDTNSGIILNKDKTSYINEGDEYYVVFENLTDAQKYCHSYVENYSSVDCIIYDNANNHLECINNPYAIKIKYIFDDILNKIGIESVDTNPNFKNEKTLYNYFFKYRFIKNNNVEFVIEFSNKGVNLDIDRTSNIIKFDTDELNYSTEKFIQFVDLLFSSYIDVKYMGSNYTSISFYKKTKQIMKLKQYKKTGSIFNFKQVSVRYEPIIVKRLK